MKHLISKEDQEFKNKVESCIFPISEFNHRMHIRLAYVYLAKNSANLSVQYMKTALTNLLKHANIDTSQKYHETLTKAWVLVVRHFMKSTSSSKSADNFIEQNTTILDSNIMLTHYSAQVLFSDQAQQSFVEPNIKPIPRYNELSGSKAS